MAGSTATHKIHTAYAPITCAHCGTAFRPRTKNQKYCSPSCTRAATATRHRERLQRSTFVILDRDGFRCAYCGRTSYEDGAVLEIDHIVPESLGGLSVAGNLLTICVTCNREKLTRMLYSAPMLQEEVHKRNVQIGLHDDTPIKTWRK